MILSAILLAIKSPFASAFFQYNNIIMEYQKIINLLNNTQNEPSKFRTRNWVKINHEYHEECITSVIKLNLKIRQ